MVTLEESRAAVLAHRVLLLRRFYHVNSHTVTMLNRSKRSGDLYNVDSADYAKRAARQTKLFPRKLSEIRERWTLHDNFVAHRKNIIAILQNEANVKGLFHKNNLPSSESVDSPEDLERKLGSLTYYHGEIEATLMLLCQYMLNSIIVEINVRKLFASDEIPKVNPYLYQEFINGVTNESKKAHILKLLSPLYHSADNSKPPDFQNFFANLEKNAVDDLLESFSTNDSFNDLGTYRYLFQRHKSSDYVNYDISDLVLAVKSNEYPKFQTRKASSEEYIRKLEEVFHQYELYKSREELMKSDEAYLRYLNDKSLKNFEALNEIYKSYVINVPRVQHLELGLSIVKVLLTCNLNAPDLNLFKYLLDKLGSLQLYNYQSLVYKCLPAYLHSPSALADEPELQAYHFQHIIEQTPEILSSLIQYNSHRENLETFKQLLSFYQLDDIIESEKQLDKSYLQSILSKSRFVRHRDRQLNLSEIDFSLLDPIMVTPESIYITMNCCIELKQYQFIDLLFNKILMHSVETENGETKVVLSLGTRPVGDLLVSKNYSLQDVSERLFTKQLFKILIRASRESDDLGRLMWLLPHLDSFLSRELVQIVDLPNDCNKESCSIDRELIKEIYDTLLTFGLEGKVVTYNEILQFDKTLGT